MSLNIHIYPSPFKNESRILKITKSLADNRLFDQILIIGVLEDGVSENESLDEHRRVLRLPRKIAGNRSGLLAKLLKTFEWYLRLLYALGNKKAECINCHSLSILPVCVLLKYLCGAKLIYDPHELETESAGSHGVRKLMSKVVERLLIGFADVVIVVSESISQWYKKTYGLLSVPVILNTPSCPQTLSQRNDYLRQKFLIDDEAIVFIYLGVLGKGRGIEILLDAFAQTKSNCHMIFMGYGALVDHISAYEKQSPHIHFHPAVPPGNISQHLGGADVGVSLIENICLSYYYCLPNKLFEYLSNSLPVLVSNFPEMSKVVNDNDCGWGVSVNVKSITNMLESVTRDEIESKKSNTISCGLKYDWAIEEKTLLNIYNDLLNKNNPTNEKYI